MKLYLIKRNVYAGFDQANGFVVRASNPKEARKIASTQHGDEGEKVWLDPEYTTCRELKVAGKAEIIIRDFHAG